MCLRVSSQGSPAIAYFRYVATARAPFTVTVTPLSGDPDLLMSVSSRPNTTWAQWSSLSTLAELVSVQVSGGGRVRCDYLSLEIIVLCDATLLSISSPCLPCPPCPQWTEPWLNPSKTGLSFPVTFYIGVSGFDGAAQFSLSVTSNPYVMLESGVPQAAQGSPTALTYFLLDVPATGAAGVEVGFTAVLTPLDGDPVPRLYVNTVNFSQHSCAHCGWPRCSDDSCAAGAVYDYNRRWSSDEALDPLVVDVDVMDPHVSVRVCSDVLNACLWCVEMCLFSPRYSKL